MKRLLAFMLSVAAAGAFAQEADLNKSPAYVRYGFDPAWTRYEPKTNTAGWLRVEPAGTEGRALMMRDIDLPESPSKNKWSLLPMEAAEYTVLIPFDADLALINLADPAVYLAHIGQSWELFLNGQLIRSELKPSRGEGYISRSARSIVIPLDKRFMQRGRNVLAFRIYGDQADDRTGFNMLGPYLVGSFRAFSSRNSEYLGLMFIGIYAFFALYHVILFALRPQFKGYLYFGAATLLLAVYQGVRTTALAQLVPNSDILVRVEYAALFLMAPCFFSFLEVVVLRKVRKTSLYIFLAFLTLAVAAQVFRREPFLMIWYVVTVAALAYYLVGVLLLGTAWALRELGTGTQEQERAPDEAARKGGGTSRPHFLRRLLSTDSGKLLAGAIVLGVSVVSDMIFVNRGMELATSKYAFFLFLLSAASVLASQFTRTFDELETMTAGLERTVKERTASLSQAAEERTRLNAEIAGANRELRTSMEIAERDMAIAVSVQKGFFPAQPPRVEGWDIAFVFEPAAGVSGDFYDFYERDGALSGMLVGDVSGHGIASGLITVLARNVFFRRSSGREKEPLGSVLSEVNRELVRELSSVDNYLTCAFLRIGGNRVEYVNAAHTDALFRKGSSGGVIALSPKDGQDFKAPPLGRDGLEVNVKALAFRMEKGDSLLLYTDCLTEGRDKQGREYGEERLMDALKRADAESAQSILASIMIEYRNFTSGARRSDDLTAVVLRRI